MKKAAGHLPQSPRKTEEIIQSLASKYQIRIKMHKNRGLPRKELSEKRKDWRSDMTYTNPGRQDNVNIRKLDGERKYLPAAVLVVNLEEFTGYNQW